MPSCAIAKCSSNENNCKEKGITFHRIPKDKGLRKAWVHACKRADKFNVDSVKVCSLHFVDDDFERDLKSELLNLKPVKQLKFGVIPHFNIPTVKNKSVDSERTARIKKRENKATVRRLCEESNGILTGNLQVEGNDLGANMTSNCSLNEPPHPNNLIADIVPNNNTAEEINSLKNENLLLKEQIKIALQELSSEKNKNLVLQNNYSKIKNIFSDNQIQVLEKGACSNWSSEDISKAVTLR